jgi:DNA-binding NarL/FixJ family response regulator
MEIQIRDEYLVDIIRLGSIEAYTILSDRYLIFLKAYIRKKGSWIYSLGGEYDDLIYLGQQEFNNAIEKFSSGNGYFYLYWQTILSHAFQAYYQKLCDAYYQAQNINFELDDYSSDEDNPRLNSDLIGECENIPAKLDFERMMNTISDSNNDSLTLTERKIIAFKLNGESFEKIGERLNLPTSTVRAMFYKARSRLEI